MGQQREVGEEASADDEVARGVELEEEWVVRLKGAEVASAAGLPEVNLVEVAVAEELEPVVVGDGDEGAHDL